jgi:hypothetical protein
MSMTFTKLFSSLTESTIWREKNHIRIVWITMMAMADKHGRVWGSIPGLAARAKLPVAQCAEALEKFMAPDPYSRTKVLEGRRIEEIDGGWRLINHAKYRELRDLDERRIYKTVKQKEYRKRKAVDKSVDKNPECGHNAEAEADADADAELNTKQRQLFPQPDECKSALDQSLIAQYRHWSSKSDSYKKKNRWVGPIPKGAVDG